MFTLKEYMPSYADIILAWLKDEMSFRRWSADKYKNYPAKAQDMNDLYAKLKAEGGMPLAFCEDDKIIGHLIVRPLEDKTIKTCRFGFIVVDSSVRGKGYGKVMLHHALKFVSDVFDTERVTLGVFENNPKALKCYESVGFCLTDDAVYYTIGDEKWKCLEMEYLCNRD